jgi:hypothetical protein
VKNQFYLALIVICVSRPKSASFSSDSGFSRRGAAETWKRGRTKGTFGPTCTLNILGDRTNYKAKDIIEKITNLFCIYEKFTICNTYIIYGDRTIIAIIMCDVRRRIRHLFNTFAVVFLIALLLSITFIFLLCTK